MAILETERLTLRELTPSEDDAAFILELLNQPSFVRFIGDKGVRTLDDARGYILRGPVASYERHGFGLWKVEPKETKVPAGICGLIKRDVLADVDIGFAFLPQFWSMGYAYESVSAVMRHATNVLGLTRVVAVTNPDNERSIKLLEKIGLKFERMVRLSEDEAEIKLFMLDVQPRAG